PRPRSRRQSSTSYRLSPPPPGNPGHTVRETPAAPHAHARSVVPGPAGRPAEPLTPACSAYAHRTRYTPSAPPPLPSHAAECCPRPRYPHRGRRRSAFIPSPHVAGPLPAADESEESE